MLTADTVSDAWLAAIRVTRPEPSSRVYHLVVGVDRPTRERPDVRKQADALIAAEGLQPIETVANTIFPAALSRSCRDHADLVARYHQMYRRIRRFGSNRRGTYFGRLTAYPVGRGPQTEVIDQVRRIIGKINSRRVAGAVPHAQYEATLEVPHEDKIEHEAVADAATVHHVARDTNPVGFPCLSHLAFQVDGDQLHAVAHYRSQFLIERAYGNYLGLGRLLEHVASNSGLSEGRLTVVAGYAQIERARRQVDALLARESAS
jgi:hypothetical protein